MKLSDYQQSLCKTIHLNPGATAKSLNANPGSLRSLLKHGHVIDTDGILSLSDAMTEQVCLSVLRDERACAEQPNYFKPLNPKFFISARGPRDTEAPREFHPVTLSSNVPYSHLEY